MHIYKRIKEIADKKRIQQKEIAAAMNVTTATVNNWFQENTSMKAEQIPLIAKLLRVSIEQLFQEVGTPLQKNLIAEEVINVANDPCANCAKMQEEINRLNKALVASKEETIAALKGDHWQNRNDELKKAGGM